MGVSFQGVDYTNGSAVDVIKALLRPYGLEGLASGMYQVGKDSNNDPNVAYVWLRQQPEYKAAFPGMAIREQKGLAPIDEETYIQHKSAMRSIMQQNGIPSNFYDGEDDFAQFIGGDISPKEIEDRVTKGIVAARNAPQDVKDALFNYYGIDEGRLAAYWLDPSPQRGDALLREQAATYVGAAAKRAKFENLSRAEAEMLAAREQSPDEIEKNLGDLVQGKELLQALPSEVLGTMTREEQLQYAAGDTAAQRELAKRAQARKAQFAGGGGFVDAAQGVSGLGSAT